MIAIPMGTHYTTLMTDLFLHVYEPDFSSLIEIEMYLKAINFTLCCIIATLSASEWEAVAKGPRYVSTVHK
jgi:hypothetical protein